MEKTAVFPGSFDPITIGHVDIVNRALPLFDKLVIAIGNNSRKTYLFPLEKRMQFIEAIFKDNEKVTVQNYEGLTIDFCKKITAKYMLRGLRSSGDFEYEKTVAQLNYSMADDIQTICLVSRPEYSHISSTIVREIIMNGGKSSQFIPKEIVSLI